MSEFTPQKYEIYTNILMRMSLLQVKHAHGGMKDLYRAALDQALEKMDMDIGIQIMDLIHELVIGDTSEKAEVKAEFAKIVANQNLEKVKELVRFVANY